MIMPETTGQNIQLELAYEVKLEGFEGPLDLLLHLVRKHELDIFDIPIAFITEQYLEYLDLMKALNLDALPLEDAKRLLLGITPRIDGQAALGARRPGRGADRAGPRPARR